MEYAPTPLFGSGSPELAGPELTRSAMGYGPLLRKVLCRIAERAADRLGIEPATS